MKRYSPERKAAVLAKLLPPYNMTVTALFHRHHLHQRDGFITPDFQFWGMQNIGLGSLGKDHKESNE